LVVYRSNRAEFLARLLATQLRLAPPPPLETAVVVVNTWPTSRWLGERLAEELGGVAANLRFPFPAARLRLLVEELLAEPMAPHTSEAAEEAPSDPWRASRLVWPLLELLPSLAASEAGAPLRRWLERRSEGRRLDLATWQLGRAIADAFDDYALYRPDLLRAWEAGKPWGGSTEPLPESLAWQPPLYAALRKRLGVEPGGLRMERAIERLHRPGHPPGAAAEQPLRLFGLSSLAPVQVRLLQALAGHRRVELYLLTPCADLWQRCQDRRRQLQEALQNPLDLDWLLAAPPLEARFGRLGAEFQQLLEGTGDAQLGEERTEELFFAPARRHPGGVAAAPLLAQLQEQLADRDAAMPLTLPPDDSSLEFHPCPGPLRQVEIVRDRLLQWMADDPSLQPRDILVMTPQVDALAPLVAAVFGDREAVGVSIPWRLTDRSQQSQAGIGRTLLALLRLGGERLTASALEGLLECPPLLQRFDLAPREAARLHGVLQRCGFRWGLDGPSRGGDPVHSLAWAIDRLLLGLVLPERAGLALAEGGAAVAPLAADLDLALCGRWLHLLTRLRHWLGQLAIASDVEGWAKRLRELLTDLFGDGGEAAWELPTLLAAIDGWQEAAAASPLVLDAPVVAAVLDEALAVDSGRFGHRSGSLTISALEPMRAIPHRVIVLLGLDAGVFPRQRDRPGFHLMERQRRLGDPHPADQDRYVLLEALLSARSHLLITWSSRDDRSGEPLPPAGPVRQWLQWLEGQLDEGALARLVADHPAGPLERGHFLPSGGRPPASCDRRRLEARRRLEQDPPAPPHPLVSSPALAPPAPEASLSAPADRTADLAAWLRAPQKQWLQQLGMRPQEWMERLEDLEPLELEERQRFQLLRPLLAPGSLEDPRRPEQWLERNRGQGTLPAGAAGALEAQALAERWSSLQETLESLGEPWQEPLDWGGWQAAPLWRGDTVVVVHPGRPNPGVHMELWLHLQVAAAAAGHSGRTPAQAALIARDGNRLVVERRLQAPEPQAAREELERLAALREQWRQACWPVPPRSGWAWCERERERAGTGFAEVVKVWEGDGHARAEGQEPEMVVCFGAERPALELVDGAFGERAMALYDAVLAAVIRPPRRGKGE